MTEIDLSYRPDTYWPESFTPEQRLSQIKGKVRQDMARAVYQEQGFTGLDPFIARQALSEAQRMAWGAVHPSCLGGEFLPEMAPREVEIARVSLASVTSDQISVRAYQKGPKIGYRIVGEYEEDGMSYQQPFDESYQPLTLQELMSFIDGSGIPGDIYEGGILTSNWTMMNSERCSIGEIKGFTQLSSGFYPQIADYYELLADEWIALNVEQPEDEDGGEDEDGDS